MKNLIEILYQRIFEEVRRVGDEERGKIHQKNQHNRIGGGGGGVKTRELRSLMSEGNQALRKMKRELGAVLAGKWAERKGNGRDEPLE